MKHLLLIIISTLVFDSLLICQIQDLQNWLSLPDSSRQSLELLSFSKKALTIHQSEVAANLLMLDHQNKMTIEYGSQWDSRSLLYQNYTMPFYYQIFGSEPSDGRSLFISLHGGGGTTAAVNNQQYVNQQHLYDATMNGIEGVYLAPRAPTNTWNLWHQSHIDEFLNIIIQMAVIKENVNPNKVYLLGYSAGGDGVYQLAPRMANRWAAASMMAGHPNNASPLGLRNTPFAIHVGALDAAYNRNTVAEQWGVILDSLELNDNGGYVHDVQLHAGLGHWMNLQDAVALPWMKNFTRKFVPNKIVWKQSSRNHSQFYWLGTHASKIQNGGVIRAEYDTVANSINITENYSDSISIYVNDEMLDFDNNVSIQFQGNELYNGPINRSILNLYNSIQKNGDKYHQFPCNLTLLNNDSIFENNVDQSTVAIKQVKSIEWEVSIYPNPTNEKITIDFKETKQQENPILLTISDNNGVIIFNKDISNEISENIYSFTGELCKGLYIVKLKSGNSIRSYKFIKQ